MGMDQFWRRSFEGQQFLNEAELEAERYSDFIGSGEDDTGRRSGEVSFEGEGEAVKVNWEQ